MAKSKKSKKKKRRINTRVLWILGLTSMIFVGVAGGLVYITIKGSVGRNLAAGQAFLDEGDHESALRSIGKVLYKESGNQQAHELRIKIYEDMLPESAERASKLYRDYVVALAQHSQFTPGDEALAMRPLEELWDAAISTDQMQFWTQLEGQAEGQRALYEPGSPVYNRATLLLGLAKMRLGQSNFLGDVDELGNVRFPGETELAEYLGLEPDNEEGLARLAFGRMAVARRLGSKGLLKQEERNLALAQETYDRAISNHPRGQETLLAVVRHLYVHELLDALRGTENPDLVDERLQELNEQLALAEEVISDVDTAQRHQVLELSRYLSLIDLEDGRERAINLLRKWAEANPDDLNAKVRLASNLQIAGQLEEAEKFASEVVDSPALKVSLESYQQQIDRLQAGITLFNLIEDQRDEKDSELLRRDAVDARGRVVDLVGGDAEHPVILELDGRLASIDNRHLEAIQFFEQAQAVGSTLASDSLLQLATSLERIGQGGLAAERLGQAVEADPRSVSKRVRLAALYGRLRDYRRSLAVLAAIPESVREENPTIVQLEESMKVGLSRGEIADLEDVNDPALRALAQVEDLLEQGRGTEGAALLEQMIEQSPEDIRLLVGLAEVYSREKQQEKAVEVLQRAREIQPNNPQLERLVIQYSINDPVGRLIEQVQNAYPEGEQRDVALFLALDRLASNRAQLEPSTSEEQAENEEIIARAQAQAATLKEVVEAAVGRDMAAFSWKLETLLREGRFDEAEQMIPLCRTENLDQTDGNLTEARVLLARAGAARAAGQNAESILTRATAAAMRATEIAPWRNATWRTLAEAQINQGDRAGARAALANVVERDPNDVESARMLAALHFQEGGDPQEGVKILADASQRQPANVALRDIWLRMEAAYGDPARALAERQRDHFGRPDDRAAALWYAGLLAALPAEHQYALDETGKPVVSARGWLAMNSDQQEAFLENVKDVSMGRIAKIADSLDQESNRTVQEAIQHATILREIGQRAKMVEITKQYAESNRGNANITTEVIQLANFLLRSDRMVEAENLMREYRDQQDSGRLEIDRAAAEMLHGTGYCDRAMEFLNAVAESSQDVTIRMRMADCLIRLQRLDEAEDVVDGLALELPNDYEVALLGAGIHRSRGKLAEASGDIQTAKLERDQFRSELERASTIRSDLVAPYIHLVRSLVQEYRRTLDRSKLEQALRYLDAAEAIEGSEGELAIQRADVLESLGQARDAVLVLEAALRRDQNNREVRRRIASAYVTAGMEARAIETLRQAISRSPRDPFWHALLADHLRQTQGDSAEATNAYIKAWRLEPTRRRATALLDATRTTNDWDYAELLDAISEVSSTQSDDPRLGVLKARAEAGLNLLARSRETMRESYAAYQSAIEEGSVPPQFLNDWYNTVYVLFPGGDLIAPLGMIESVAGEDPSLMDLRGIALVHSLRGGDEIKESVRLMTQVVEAADEPNLIEDLSRLGSYQLMAGEDVKAVDTYQRVVELQPDDPVGLNNYAYLVATVLEDPQRAEPYARQAIALRPTEPSFLDTMAEVQMQLGNYQSALSSLMSRLAIEPNNVDLLRSIAGTLVDHLNRPEEAVNFMDQALELDPRGAETLRLAGWAYWNEGSESKGRDLVSQSIRRQPSAEAHLDMARILAAAGDGSQARDHLQQAANLAQDQDIQKRIEKARADLDGGG